MAKETVESNGSRESEGKSEQPDFKWAVEYLVRERGQRHAAKLLGVNRKTVALALRRDRLTARMNHAVQTFIARADDHGGQKVMPLDRMQSQIGLLLESMDEFDRLAERLTQRVEALEEAQARLEADFDTDEAAPVELEVAVEREGQQDEPAEELETEPEREQAGRRLGWWGR